MMRTTITQRHLLLAVCVLQALLRMSMTAYAAVTSSPPLGGDAVVHVPAACSQAQNCTAAISEALAECAALTGPCTVQLEAGRYDVHAEARQSVFFLHHTQNLTIAGEGSDATELVFDNVAAFFEGYGCRGLTFRGFSVDMARVPYTEGVVVDIRDPMISIDGMEEALVNVTVRVEDTTLYPVDPATVAAYNYLAEVQAVIGYDAELERFTQPDLYMLSDPVTARYSGGQFVSMVIPASTASRFTPGQSRTVLRHQVYGFNAFTISLSADLRWDDVVLYAAGGMGVYTFQATGVSITNYKTQRKRIRGHAARAMSITADGIHLCGCRGGAVTITDSVLEGQGDDGVNVYTPFARASAFTAATRESEFEQTTKATTRISLVGAQPRGVAAMFAEGDALDLFDWRTLLPVSAYGGDGDELARPIVTAVDVANSTICVTPAIPASQFERLRDVIISNAATVADHVVVRASTFKNNRARGVLMEQPNALIESSTFSGMTSPAIMAQVDGCYWFEGRPIANWTVRSCVFDTLDPWGQPSWILPQATVSAPDAAGRPSTRCVPAESPGVFRNITIERNYFVLNASVAATPNVDNGVVYAVDIFGSNGVSLASNNAVAVNGFNNTRMAMRTVGCTNVTAEANWCSDPAGDEYPCIIP